MLNENNTPMLIAFISDQGIIPFENIDAVDISKKSDGSKAWAEITTNKAKIVLNDPDLIDRFICEYKRYLVFVEAMTIIQNNREDSDYNAEDKANSYGTVQYQGAP